MHEKRLTARLTKYWERIKKDDPLPRFVKFNPSAIEDVWENCFQLKSLSESAEKRSYTYEYMGDKLVEAYGRSLVGQQAGAHFKNLPGSAILKKLPELESKLEPVYDDGQFINDKHKVVKYRACLLPFGDVDSGLTHVVCGLSWKSFG